MATNTYLLIGCARCLCNDHCDVITGRLEYCNGVMVVCIHQVVTIDLCRKDT